MANTVADDCTPATCPITAGFLSEPPSLVGSAVILAAFAILALVNMWIGVGRNTATYSLVLVAGLVLEVVGYSGRLLLRSDAASRTYFTLFLLGTVAGPTLITAAIFTILPHILAIYGSDVNIIPKPIWATYIFLFFDIFSLFFQVLGSAFATKGFDKLQIQIGLDVALGGLALQLASIVTFYGLYFYFMLRVAQNREFIDPRFSDVYLSPRFKAGLLCTHVSLAFILVRTVARMVQLSSGFDSALSQSQTYIPVLDSALVILAGILITIAPPASAFGRYWAMTSPRDSKARRHSSALRLSYRPPASPSHDLYGSPVPSPRRGYLNHNPYIVPANIRRYSSSWTGSKYQPPLANPKVAADPPAYERPPTARVPYMPPPPPTTLSDRYGQGRVVESQVTAPGSEGSRTGVTGSSGGRTRIRGSPRVYEEDLVRHDAIW